MALSESNGTNQQLERARAKVEREQQRNKHFTARRMREIFDVDLADYEQHQPEEGVYCINPHNVRTFNCSQRLLSKFTYSQFLRLLWPRVSDTPMAYSIEVAEADSGVQIDVRDR